MPTDPTCRCGCGQERQRQADGRLGAWASPGCAAQARTRTPRHPDPLAPLRGESRTEEIIASQLRSTAADLQGMDLAMQQRLKEQARAQKEREARAVVTCCPDCGGRAYLEPEVTRILPDGSSETYTPLRCAKRCKSREKEESPMSGAPILTEPAPDPSPARPCECGCGRPVGPRGKRFASPGCASRLRGKMSPEARANMSAAAKARVARNGYVVEPVANDNDTRHALQDLFFASCAAVKRAADENRLEHLAPLLAQLDVMRHSLEAK